MTMTWSTNRDGHAHDLITVTVPDKTTLLTQVRHRLETGTGFSVATLNLDHVVKLAQDPVFAAAYAAHTHVTADGNPIVWFSRLAGEADIQLAPGSELVLPIAALAADCAVAVALVGSTSETLAAAAKELSRQYPRLNIVYQYAPAMGFDPSGDEADRIIEGLRSKGVQLVFLALGAPRQECFAAYAQTRLPGCGFLSIGAGLDFVAGVQTRAPVWVRKLAAEWLWRLLGNPARLAARYSRCILILPRLLFRALAARRTGAPS